MQIKKIVSSLSENQEMQILELVANDANQISMNVFELDSPISDYLTMREIIKTRLYIARIGQQDPSSVHLIISQDPNLNIVGYVLYQEAIGQPFDISIISTIVSPKHRKQGILKKMMSVLIKDYRSINLTCFTNKVDIYKSIGFNLDCQVQTQVGMYYGCNVDGQILPVNDEDVDEIDVVKDALLKFKTVNRDKWQNMYRDLNSNNNAEILKVKRYVNNYGR